MKNSRSIFWGGMLIIIGIFWLLRKLDIFFFHWDAILPYWPVLLILAGILLILTNKYTAARGLVGLLIVIAVFGGLTSRTGRVFDRHRDNWNFNWNDHDNDWDHDDDNDDDDDEGDNDDDKDSDYEEDSNRQEEGSYKKPVNNSYQYEMEDFIQKANFNLEGGAGSFTVKGNTDKLFEADTRSSVLGFLSNTSINKLANSATVNLKMEDGNVKIHKGELSNKADIELNIKPIWTIDLGLGAGSGNFDLSNYKVENLKVSTGVADLDIRLGDKLDNSNVKIDAGVASLGLEIPKTVGCEIKLDGALNLTSFDDLEKINDKLYRSPGFDKATKKIMISFDGGLSKVKIKRY
ncbi:LiaI-LiaF-like domain-containing protein [Dyadobacter subterraneus]|uniref:LiaF transmembrane domain-containing protein n=1 Tax=Dyadobacter subterraneus TaxID=2773304 RepID=A0ABR9W4Y1_9BACT|nr:DUF5668 domain-containing protein [Dyadobacter subterraneus]MBE9460514.1 hypothetical protein [Dyadobacter subterraneus]